MGDRYVSIASTRSRQQRFKTCLRVGGERFHLPSGEFHPILAIRPRYIILFLCRFCCFHTTDPPLSGFRYGSPFSLLFLFFFSFLSLPSPRHSSLVDREECTWNVNERIIAENGWRTAVLIARFVSQCSRCHGDRVRTSLIVSLIKLNAPPTWFPFNKFNIRS